MSWKSRGSAVGAPCSALFTSSVFGKIYVPVRLPECLFFCSPCLHRITANLQLPTDQNLAAAVGSFRVGSLLGRFGSRHLSAHLRNCHARVPALLGEVRHLQPLRRELPVRVDELLRQQERRRGPWVVPREVGAKRDFSDFLRAPRAGPRAVAL